VQGLSDEEAGKLAKAGMLEKIFEENLKLRKQK